MIMKEIHTNVASLVVIGAWNRDIFTINWVREYVLEGKPFNVLYPVQSALSLKFILEGKFWFAINGTRLEFGLYNDDALASKELLTAVRNILRNLVHTPVSSFGINFVFEGNGNGDYLSEVSHTKELKEAVGADIVSSTLIRSFNLDNNATLNIKLVQQGEKAIFDFNYDYAINKVEDMFNILGEDNLIPQKRNQSLSILQKVYGN